MSTLTARARGSGAFRETGLSGCCCGPCTPRSSSGHHSSHRGWWASCGMGGTDLGPWACCSCSSSRPLKFLRRPAGPPVPARSRWALHRTRRWCQPLTVLSRWPRRSGPPGRGLARPPAGRGLRAVLRHPGHRRGRAVRAVDPEQHDLGAGVQAGAQLHGTVVGGGLAPPSTTRGAGARRS
ncbi:hypothetical protein QJS66_01440 [Kocuria rhizophila]|nr:hypothetical protein QJS66_01440 [Kocuria rhizophila]